MNRTTFEQIFAIMQRSFPDNEYRTFEGQLALLNNPHYRLITDTDQSGTIIAFLACWEFPKFRFVEHLAVDPDIRGGGIGKQLMLTYMKQSDKPVLLEVEPPLQEMAQRRVGFYERLGFHLNPYPYVQPPLREGQAELPLCIMTSPQPVEEQEFLRFREVLYREVYRTVSA
ncbi:GNAT family N-acetyltransferase [Paenibacillus donghaensis]|uniref:GNAT family N-acetyltransferase n=1 Tax=Paenibacillus donghaensis TaxID=414771 RepID=A0A2Z2KQ20_9BACL|nr:GNAT family N-acetyltransferase [Paenibacillus donghaensis]ASA25863.1 GNAT family N-acetyltransferase [Paenibacillus donghaensis]